MREPFVAGVSDGDGCRLVGPLRKVPTERGSGAAGPKNHGVCARVGEVRGRQELVEREPRGDRILRVPDQATLALRDA